MAQGFNIHKNYAACLTQPSIYKKRYNKKINKREANKTYLIPQPLRFGNLWIVLKQFSEIQILDALKLRGVNFLLDISGR